MSQSVFQTSNSRLSQAASRLVAAETASRQADEEYYEMDYKIDYGEFTGPPSESMMEKAWDEAAKQAGCSPEELAREIESRTSSRWLYFRGWAHFLPGAKDRFCCC